MSRFVLIYQQFFGDARGIKIEELKEGITREEAEFERIVVKGHLADGVYEVKTKILEIGDRETTALGPIKLTWKERLTGRFHPRSAPLLPSERLKAKAT